MTNGEEKLAEEYIKTNPSVHIMHCFLEDRLRQVKKVYLDGIAEGKPKWHDLKKNPDDVPTELGYYWFVDTDGSYATIRNLASMTPSYIASLLRANDAIAWCKLSTFEVEK